MPVVDFSEGAEKRHSEIFDQVQVIWSNRSSRANRPTVNIFDEAESFDPKAVQHPRGCLTMARGRMPALIGNGDGAKAALHYADPWSEATIAAFVAAVTRIGAPIAHDAASLSVIALAERLAASNIPVLINGPTGTGKEVLSRFIHDHSARAGKPFIAINCAAVPEAMLEALLFGHQKGAFTGAANAAEGFFRAGSEARCSLTKLPKCRSVSRPSYCAHSRKARSRRSAQRTR